MSKDDDGKTTFTINTTGQLGGVNVGQLNMGRPPRRLDVSSLEALKAQIPLTDPITVTSAMNDPEAYNYAEQTMNWLKANGYTDVRGINQAMWGRPVEGQFVQPVDPPQDGVKWAFIVGNQPR